MARGSEAATVTQDSGGRALSLLPPFYILRQPDPTSSQLPPISFCPAGQLQRAAAAATHCPAGRAAPQGTSVTCSPPSLCLLHSGVLPNPRERQTPPYLIEDPHCQDRERGVHDVVKGDEILVVDGLEREQGATGVNAGSSFTTNQAEARGQRAAPRNVLELPLHSVNGRFYLFFNA